MTVTRYELQEEVPVVAEGQPYETPDTLRIGAIMVSEYDYDELCNERDALKDRIKKLEAQRETQHIQALDRAIANKLLLQEIDRLSDVNQALAGALASLLDVHLYTQSMEQDNRAVALARSCLKRHAETVTDTQPAQTERTA